MAGLGIVSKRIPYVLLFYAVLASTIGKGAVVCEERPKTRLLARRIAVEKVYGINPQVFEILNKSLSGLRGDNRVRTEKIEYSDGQSEKTAHKPSKFDEKNLKFSILTTPPAAAAAILRRQFRRRRNVEDLENVVDVIANDTSGINERSPIVSTITTDFGAGHIGDHADLSSNAEELTFGNYNNNRDFNGEDYSDAHKGANNLHNDDQVKIAGTSANDHSNEDKFDSPYPDYHWSLSSIIAEDARVSSGIEPISIDLEDPSWDDKMKLSNSQNQDTKRNSQSDNQLLPSREDLFEDLQSYPPQENPTKEPDWRFNTLGSVSSDGGHEINSLDQRVNLTKVPLILTTTKPLVQPPNTLQGCQITATEPPVDECGYSEKPQEPGVHLVSLRWREVGIYFTITAFVIFAGLGKLVFHKMHWLSSRVPESCLLIVLGVLMGLLVHFAGGTDSSDKCKSAVSFPTFSSQVFFMVLLPPIILEAAYSLHDRCFIDNLGTVLVFAVLGTLMNVFLVGFSLWGLAVVGGMGEITITLTESLVFASLISAVDPVAVLSIFQELGVNKGLYFLVFGESLLNDGVTVVVYNMFSSFMEMPTIKAEDYALSVAVFFVVVAGGTLIGIIFGVVTALFTKYTDTVRVVEPLALLGLAYLAYITAEIFHFSGIISLIVTGLVQAQYAYPNISQKSYTTVKYFIKMASATSDTIIFMFLGMVLVHDRHVWQTGFVLWTLILCLVIRLVVTLILAVVTNRHRLHPIGIAEQLILAYGGLRGAVAFSLVSMMPGTFEHKELFITATLVVIIFTVFVQGITVGPMVTFLNVALSSTGPKHLLQEVNVKVVDTMMAGIEEVIGRVGDNKVRESLKSFNDKYFMKWLTIPSNEDKLTKLFEKIAITEHYANLYGPNILIERAKEELTASRQDLALGLSPYGSHFSVANFAEAEADVPVRTGLGASLRVLG